MEYNGQDEKGQNYVIKVQYLLLVYPSAGEITNEGNKDFELKSGNLWVIKRGLEKIIQGYVQTNWLTLKSKLRHQINIGVKVWAKTDSPLRGHEKIVHMWSLF